MFRFLASYKYLVVVLFSHALSMHVFMTAGHVVWSLDCLSLSPSFAFPHHLLHEFMRDDFHLLEVALIINLLVLFWITSNFILCGHLSPELRHYNIILPLISFFISYLLFPNVGLTPSGLRTQMPVDQMPVWGAQIMDHEQNTERSTRESLPESVVNRMSGFQSETTQDRTQTKNTHPDQG